MLEIGGKSLPESSSSPLSAGLSIGRFGTGPLEDRLQVDRTHWHPNPTPAIKQGLVGGPHATSSWFNRGQIICPTARSVTAAQAIHKRLAKYGG